MPDPDPKLLITDPYPDPTGSGSTTLTGTVRSAHLNISEVVVVENDLDALHLLRGQLGRLPGHRSQNLVVKGLPNGNYSVVPY